MRDAAPSEITCRTAFTVYDGRGHVLGASMLSDIDARLRAAWPEDADAPCAVKRAKFLHKTCCDGDITVRRGGSMGGVPDGAACSVAGQYGAVPVVAWFVPDACAPVTKRADTAHDIAAIEPAGEFAGRCHIASERFADFLLLIVDANKHVQLATPPLRGRKWISELVSIERFAMHPSLCPVDSALEIEHLANRTAGDRIFTLNRLRFSDGSGGAHSLDMGFSFYPEQTA